MSMTRVSIAIPAHLVPGGLPAPIAEEFGFKHVERTFINTDDEKAVTFTFSHPAAACSEVRFDKALEHYFWHFAKQTPFTIEKLFNNQPEKRHQCKYVNNQLIKKHQH